MKIIKSITLLAIAFSSSSLLYAQSSNLVVGSNSSGQTLALTNGTNAYSNTYIGYNAGASNNFLSIANTNTLFSNSADVYVGYSGSSNAMVISNGAKVINDNGYNNTGYIGYNASSSNNSVTVTGANSLWTNYWLFIGYDGAANSLVISNRGTVAAYGVFVGADDVTSSDNTVLVTGSNSSLLAGGDGGLEVGGVGSGNHLVVSLGGLVVSEDNFTIGFNSSNNSVIVTDSGSSVNAQSFSFIGYNGSFNSLVISNGGTVLGVESYIGYWEDPIPSSNNRVQVTGSNSLWSNSDTVTVGCFGNANSLLVSNGGTVITGTNLFIGQGADSSFATWPQPSNNRLMVTGSGSSLTNGGALYVGYYGASNALTVSEGGRVINLGNGYIGYATTTYYGANNYSASNNSVLVAGSNSLLSNADSLYVGYAGSSNTLVISNGGTVSIGGGSSAIGYASNSTGNSVLVTGESALWNNAGSLYVGYAGSSNVLMVSNGGRLLTADDSYIGYNGSSYNRLVVTGSGSLWSNDGFYFTMGNIGGSSNSLTVSEGGMVATLFSAIGGSSSSNNSVLVTGAGSQWSCLGLLVGGYGPSNSLTISNGGTVTVYTDSALGYGSNSSGNRALITGSNSLWSNTGTLTIGDGGSGTVTVANGGKIVASQILIGTNGDLDFGRFNGNDFAGAVVTPSIYFTGTNGDDYGINFNQIDTLYLTSSVSGAGWVCALGAGTTVMSGSNSYSLYTKIDAGTVVAASTNALGTGYLGIGGYADLAVIRLATNLTVGDFIWGSNGIVSLTAGSQTLTVAGMTNLVGTNGGNVFDFLGGGSSLILNNNTNALINFTSQAAFTTDSFSVLGISGYSFSTNGNQISSYISTSANVGVSTAITINGTLVVNSLTVNPAGTLQGTGTLFLTGGNLNVNGTLAPGNSPGTFYVSGGDLVMGSTAVWDQQIYSSTSYDRVVVTGSAFLNGVMNIATFGSGDLQFGQKYNFLTASGGISGAFSSIIAPEGYRGRLFVSGTQANILIAPASYTQLAQNRNQSNVATALNSFIPCTSGDQLFISTSLDSLTASEYNQAFNAIMPTFYQQIVTIAFNNANAQNMQLNQRLWGLRVAEGGGFSMSGLADNFPILEGQGDGSGKGVLDSKKDILRPGLDNHWGMFVDGNGIFAQANSANMLPGYNSQSGGVTTGLTYKWNDSFASGIYCGYQGTYTKSGANGSGLGTGSSLIDNAVRFGVFGTYGRKDGKGLYANALAGGAYHNFQATRVIQYTGMNRTANSSPGAGELDTMLATGYDIQKGKFTFGPTASLQYTYLGVNSLHETGAQSLNFSSGGWNSSSMLSSVGAHAAYSWMAHKDVVVVPQINLSWQHEFMQNPYAINGTLGGTSPTFSNWSATPIRDFLYTGVGFTVEFAKRCNTSFFYNAAAGNSDLVSQNIFWSAGVKF